MNILFLIYHGFSNISGISKKINAQVEGLRQNGHKVYVCSYIVREDGHRCRMIDDEVLEDYGTGKLAQLKKRTCYGSLIRFCTEHAIQAVYVRSFHNANPWTIHLFSTLRRKGIPAVMEIPTYPYDQEYVGFPLQTRMELQVDKLFRHRLAREMAGIVTFSSEEKIFGQRTIRISNGISFEDIPLRNPQKPEDDDTIHLLGVAEVHYWHGFDRVISGIGEYYKNGGTREVKFHIIGGIGDSEMHDSQHAPGFEELISKYDIRQHICFEGAKYGQELNDHFNMAHFAIGSLGRHRSGITDIKTLKNREYAARGIAFIYSENDTDFEDKPYVIKAPADETPIDIAAIIDFVDHNSFDPIAIRDSIQQLSWKHQMDMVIKELPLR